ncbi:Radical S-adenosyl methionine domain-containing protein 1, mitochondrial [Collichthys lucidus]|uniref:Radical S-adenosyl methionine domain-containing protein 1, mitochondrial n=1 Tax=Collichthys lucidus TaxID=240159 RepID=A0A4U5VTN9_COLLU|nr:Radical S-adenosyl methionine domain-containing protein 1, mitochondrial [Collichthys lucidus]
MDSSEQTGVSLRTPLSSVFFGGGTPSLAHPSTIAALLETVSRQADLSDQAEVTLEVNPTPVGMSKLEDYCRAGVNRFSIGVQKRPGGCAPAGCLWMSCSGDPNRAVESWEDELSELLRVCDDHVSLYQLTLERGTQLFKQNAVSHHNMSYWKGRQYIGVGPGAHGRFVPLGEGGVTREARTQTLEPDVWIREVQQRGHGTRRKIQLSHLELGLRCSWDGLALLDSMLPALLVELERQICQQLQKDCHVDALTKKTSNPR